MIKYRVKLIGTPDVVLKSTPRITTEALKETPRLWHARFFRRHFQGGAAARYGYRPRSTKYVLRKKRKFGHTAPLIYTGLMRKQLGRGIFVTGNRYRAKGVMHGPRYVFMRQTAINNRPYLAGEVTALAPDEERELTAHLDRFITQRINELQEPRTIIIE